MEYAALGSRVGGNASSDSDREHSSDGITDGLTKRAAHLCAIIERVDRLSNRMIGPRPRETTKAEASGQIQSGRPPLLHRLTSVDIQLGRYLDNLEQLLSEIESFV